MSRVATAILALSLMGSLWLLILVILIRRGKVTFRNLPLAVAGGVFAQTFLIFAAFDTWIRLKTDPISILGFSLAWSVTLALLGYAITLIGVKVWAIRK